MDRPWLGVLLMSIYPILVVASANTDEVLLFDLVTPLLVSSAIALLAYFILIQFKVGATLASMIVIVMLAFFYAYGHIFYSFISGIHMFEVTVGRHRFFFPLWGMLSLLVISILFWKRKYLDRLVNFFNLLLVFLLLSVVIPLVGGAIVASDLTDSVTSDSTGESERQSISTEISSVDQLPDIYYIILDGYAANSILDSLYGYDNSEFFKQLREKGFYVSEKSHANHSYTYLSLTSSLNMMYMDWLGKDGADHTLRSLGDKIGENRVARLLKERGYRYVTYDSGYSTTSRNLFADENINCAWLSEFDRTLLATTMLDPFFLYGGVRERILCQFESIGEIAEQGPDFVFAHIVAPHPPYVFDQKGNAVSMNSGLNPWADKTSYVNQLRFVNTKVVDLVDRILSHSEKNPIIIIQSDHGPASSGTEQMVNPSETLLKERMRILNSYLVPDQIREKLYPEITPVNSFRAILSSLTGVDLPLLEDKAFFTPIGQEKRTFDDVSEVVQYD